MAGHNLERVPFVAMQDEHEALVQLDTLLECTTPLPHLVGDEGTSIALPPTLRALLHTVVHQLARGHAVTVVATERRLSTQEAADLLNVSRPYLVRLLDRGDLPFTNVGSHRRIALDDLLAYKQQRDTVRRTALRELTQMSEDLGLYDAPVITQTR